MVPVDDLMTIGVFAKQTGLSISAIRFYASHGLLEPADVDPVSGYRRYSEAQVEVGALIRDLRRLGMPLSDIALVLEKSEPERKELVEQHLRRLETIVERAHGLAQTLGITNPTKETAMSATIPTLDLAGALDQVLPAAGTNPELPHLMSVLVEGKDGSVRFVATDRFRLAVRDIVPSQLDGEFTATVPAATLARWRDELDATGQIALRLEENRLELSGNGVDLTATVIPVIFPDYEQLLTPVDDVARVTVDRHRLLAVLERVEADCTVTLSVADGSLRIDHADGSDAVDAQCIGGSPDVAINARFAIDAVRNAVGADLVIEIDDASSPVLFRSADDGTFTSRVMPILDD